MTKSNKNRKKLLVTVTAQSSPYEMLKRRIAADRHQTAKDDDLQAFFTDAVAALRDSGHRARRPVVSHGRGGTLRLVALVRADASESPDQVGLAVAEAWGSRAHDRRAGALLDVLVSEHVLAA